MEDALRQYCEEHRDVFGKYKIKPILTENGTGYVIRYGPSSSPTSGAMIISDKADISMLDSVIELECGTGKWDEGQRANPSTGENTYRNFIAMAEKGDFSKIPSNAVVSIPVSYTGVYDGSLDAACGFIEQNGNKVLHIGEVGFSGSGEASIRSTANAILSGKYPDATFRCINLDAYYQESYLANEANYTDKERELVTSKLELTNFIPDQKAAKHNIGRTWGRYDYRDFKHGGMYSVYHDFLGFEKQGYNSYIYEVSDEAHPMHDQYQHEMYRDLGLYGTDSLDYLAGNVDHISNVNDLYGVIGDRKKFNLDTGLYDVAQYGSINSSYSFDFSKYFYVDDFQIKTYDSNVMNTFSPLAGMGALGLSYLNNPELQSSLHGTEIVSDLTFVSDSMNQIRTGISGTSFLSSLQGLSFRSSDGIPGCLTGYIEAYFNVVGALLNDLAQETSSVLSYAEAYADMDADLGNKAGRIAAMDADGNMTTVDPALYRRPDVTSPVSTPQAAGAIGAAGAAAAAGVGVAGSNGGTYGRPVSGNPNGQPGNESVRQSTSNEDETQYGTVFNANPEENTGDVIGKTSDGQDIIINKDSETSSVDNSSNGVSPRPSVAPVTNTQGNTSGINTETRKFEDGSYQIRRTNDKDGTTTEFNYDENGKLLSSVTRDKNGVVRDVSSYDGSVLNRTETTNTTESGATETVQHNEDGTETVRTYNNNGEQFREETVEHQDEVRQMQSTNMANTGVARRPETPEGTKPISYKRFTKEVNGDDVTYTYYDKKGNVIGETTYDKNNGHVSSSYYDYKNENGEKVRVVYDAKTADMVREMESASASVSTQATENNRYVYDPEAVETEIDARNARKAAEDKAVRDLAMEMARRQVAEDTDFEYTEEEIQQIANDIYKGLQTGGWREYESQLNNKTEEILKASEVSSVTASQTPSVVPEQTQTVVENNKPITSESTAGGTSGSGSRGNTGGYNGGSTYIPQSNVTNNTKPVTETQKPVDEIKESEVIMKPEVEEKSSTPTYTNNYGPYNYYNSTSRREETIVPSVDKSMENIDKEIKVPEVKPDVIDNNKQTIDTSIHKNNSNNNAGRVLGTIAGVAAAGAGIAGLAYGANKIIKEQDEENEEENKEEYEKDENGEISLSDEI